MKVKNVKFRKVHHGSAVVNKITGYIVSFLIGTFVTGGICWYFMDYSRSDIICAGNDFAVTRECRKIIENSSGIVENKPVEKAIQAYVENISNDKYILYSVEDETEEMTLYVNTSSTAIQSGFKVDRAEDGNILLTEVTEGMPAYIQGLRANDIITAINDVSVQEKGYENIANKMLGKDGTEVKFTVQRDGEQIDFNIIRSSSMMSNVKLEMIGDVAYIRIEHFDEFAKGQLNKALKESNGTNKVVFDVRNNPGGATSAAVYMAAECCGHSKCILKGYDKQEEVVQQDFEFEVLDKKMIVLINENSKSSAEIFAASLKSNGEATLVGVNTFGKGTFQVDAGLSNGGTLHYTAGTYIVEGWDNWDGVGIAPDVEVPMDETLFGTDDDIQLKTAISLLD